MDIQWPLAVFSTLVGAGGVLFALVGVSELTKTCRQARFNAALAALALLIVGGCASVFHLEQKMNIMAAAANVFSFSGISIELIFLGLNAVLAAVYLVAAKRSADAVARVAACIGIVTGLIMAFAVGNGYVMESRAAWNTIVLPVAYLGSGLACGAAVFSAIVALSGCEEVEVRKSAQVAACGASVALLTAVAYAVATGFALDALWFWAGAVAIGSVASAALCWFGSKSAPALCGAAACTLFGGLCLRAAMFLAGSGFIDAFALAASRTVLGV